MRKRLEFTLLIIVILIIVMVTIMEFMASYSLFSTARRFLETNSAIVGIISFLILILAWLSSFPTKKPIEVAHFIGSSLSYATSTSVVLIIILALVTWNVHLRNVSSYNYILSSISQGLAAIFALIFTITLVLSQILVL